MTQKNRKREVRRIVRNEGETDYNTDKPFSMKILIRIHLKRDHSTTAGLYMIDKNDNGFRSYVFLLFVGLVATTANNSRKCIMFEVQR